MKNFFEKLSGFLGGTVPTLCAGAVLVLSFILTQCGIIGKAVPAWLDPAWLAVIICGIPIFHEALEALTENKGISRISSELLVSFAILASIALFFISEESEESGIFAAGEVGFIMNLGELLEGFTTRRARQGLQKLISLTPETTLLVNGTSVKTVNVTEIKPGDVVRVLPGERIPVDGTVLTGESSVDQSVLTGESVPVDKNPGSAVFSGTLNGQGAIDIKATAVGTDSSLGRLIAMVKEADEKKAPTERLADRWASVLVPASLAVALITGVAVSLLTHDFYEGAYRAVTVMVVFCPCALVLATPTAIMAAIGQATSRGIVIKSGEALEKLGACDIMAMDKTGTLTEGKIKVCDLYCAGCTENELLTAAATADRGSAHPLGKAIVSCACDRHIDLPAADKTESISGKGTRAYMADGNVIYSGNAAWLAESGLAADADAAAAIDKFASEGKAISCIASTAAGFMGIIAMSDTLRQGAASIVKELSEAGTETVMLTGDRQAAAAFIASEAGVKTYRAELLPGDKNSEIEKLRGEGHHVAMVGDGVNDAPALRTSDVGISMSGIGSDIASDAADISLIHDDIRQLPYLKKLSRATVKTIKFCITLSMTINVFAIILSVSGLLGPTLGALVHNAGSVLVVAIAALLYRRKF